MEALYSKLYEKYTKMKKNKFSELDLLNKEQEEKFMNYISAAEDLIQHLRNENEKLTSQVHDLRSEVSSIRVSKDEQCAEYQKLWMEESQKNKVLASEVDSLRKLQQETAISIRNDSEAREKRTPEIVSRGLLDSSSGTMTRAKRRKLSETDAGKIKHNDGDKIVSFRGESTTEFHKEAMYSGTLVNIQQPQCCTRSIVRPGEETHDSGSGSCLFQGLIEYLVGMKFSVLTPSERICVSVKHETSGYSFSLTWLEREEGEEVELLYHVLSLGTFERVAPEWMKEAIMFSTTMFPVFLEKVSGIVRPFS